MQIPTGQEPASSFSRAVDLMKVPGAVNAYTGSHTATPDDLGKLIIMDSASANSLTIEADGANPFRLYTVLTALQIGAGLTTIVAGPGVTISSQPGLVSSGRYAIFGILKVGANSWVALGNLTT